MKWLKQCIAALVVVLFWVSTSLPASANFIKDGGFINDMEIMMEGKPGSELAIATVNANPSGWVTMAKDFCDLRRAGLSRDEILTTEWEASVPDSSPAEVNQALSLALKTMAKLAHRTYCSDVS